MAWLLHVMACHDRDTAERPAFLCVKGLSTQGLLTLPS